MYDDDEELSDVEYFVKEYMDSIELMSKCRKNDINFFINTRDMHLDDAKSDIHINHPTKESIIESIKKLGFEDDFMNVDLNDAVNAIFLHKIDEITIQDSLGELILGMTPDNYMKKLYDYNESYKDEEDVNHYKEARQFDYTVDKITDTYKILMKYIILNLKGNLATFLEDYYKTKDGIDFVNRANFNAVNGNGRITKDDFYYFVDEINKASILEPLITKEDGILIYKLPESNQLGGFFVTVNDGLKVSLSIMEATDRSGEFSRVFNNTLFAKLIYDGFIDKITQLAKKDNLTVESYCKDKIINNVENKIALMDSVFADNQQYFDDVENYSSYSSRPIYFQVNKKYFLLNQSYIDRFSETVQNINKNKMAVEPTRLKINHITILKFLQDIKMNEDIEFKLNKISSNNHYMRAFLRPCYQKNKDITRFHKNEKEVRYVYDYVIDKRCFNSSIDQNLLNDRSHYNEVIKIIIENFVVGEEAVVKRNIKSLSKQEVYNIVQYLENFIHTSNESPVETISRRLTEINVEVDPLDFINCITTNFMQSSHEGLTYSIKRSLNDLKSTLDYDKLIKLYDALSIQRNKGIKILEQLVKLNQELKLLRETSNKKNEYEQSLEIDIEKLEEELLPIKMEIKSLEDNIENQRRQL